MRDHVGRQLPGDASATGDHSGDLAVLLTLTRLSERRTRQTRVNFADRYAVEKDLGLLPFT